MTRGVTGERLQISNGWELLGTSPGRYDDPAQLGEDGWMPAHVPGTVAGALAAAPDADLDGRDWWFRVRFPSAPPAAGQEVVLGLDGLATVAEIYLNGKRLHDGESMFAATELSVTEFLHNDNDLALCFRALAPRLAVRRRPRARWRTRLVSTGNLRFYRTMLLGRAPSFSPPLPVIGPWQPVWFERREGLVLSDLRLRARATDGAGRLHCHAAVRAVAGGAVPVSLVVEISGPDGDHRAELPVDPGTGRAAGELVIPEVSLWWPHTHGRPDLHAVTVSGEGQVLHRGRVGFRQLDAGADLEAGLRLQVNGVPVFARGAVWTPLSLERPYATDAELRPVLQRVVDAGMNMLRVPGIATYESDDFYDLCDELGILVWQDFMFANLDYPEQDAEFMRTVRGEVQALLHRIGARPSLAVLCGGSEVAQQVAMLGLDPALAEGPLYGDLLPEVVADAEVDAPYIPSTPWGGDLPFRPDRGVANYYGVGAYLRPLEDARRSEVKFAGECLAFANVPDDEALADLQAPGGLSVNHPVWKAGVPRDAGTGWDFEDVRDHYLKLLYDVDPVALRWTDQGRYLELSRMVTGEVMAETFGEWRRGGSPCGGALVLWLKDLAAGAGWGVLDHRGEPKTAYHLLRRALLPVAVWTTDEGLGGVAVHIANDGPQTFTGRLRVSLYRDLEVLVGSVEEELDLGPHSTAERNVETMLGHFVDAAWAYRFGPPAQDLVAVSLEREGDDAGPVSQAFRLPAGRPLGRSAAESLGLRASLESWDPGAFTLRVSSRRFAYGVRINVPGFVPEDDAFSVEPGHDRVIRLKRRASDASLPTGSLTAVNLSGRLRLEPPS